MLYIALTLYIILEIISRMLLFDVILSWLSLFWLKIRPKFLSDIMDPIYIRIKKVFPTTIWFFDFTPIILIIILIFLKWILIFIFPEIQRYIIV